MSCVTYAPRHDIIPRTTCLQHTPQRPEPRAHSHRYEVLESPPPLTRPPCGRRQHTSAADMELGTRHRHLVLSSRSAAAGAAGTAAAQEEDGAEQALLGGGNGEAGSAGGATGPRGDDAPDGERQGERGRGRESSASGRHITPHRAQEPERSRQLDSDNSSTYRAFGIGSIGTSGTCGRCCRIYLFLELPTVRRRRRGTHPDNNSTHGFCSRYV